MFHKANPYNFYPHMCPKSTFKLKINNLNITRSFISTLESKLFIPSSNMPV